MAGSTKRTKGGGTAKRQSGRRRRGLFAAGAGIATLTMVMAGCGSASKNAGSPPNTVTTGTRSTGGTVTWAEAPDSAPDYIFPLCPSADFSLSNRSEFQELMYRPLFWFGDDGQATVDYDRSLAQEPAFSDNDTVVTVTLNNYTWSDGEKVDARDVEFWMNLLDAEKDNWAAYVPGDFPSNVTSVTAPDGPTGRVVVFKLNKSYDPTWFIYDELSQVTPLPIAWDKTSASAPTPTATEPNLPDTTTAGAVKVYNFLNTEAKAMSTYGTNPLWKIVDGPWTLQRLTGAGEATFVPNPKYTGPFQPYISKFIEEPYRTAAAEYTQVQSGPSELTVGYIPTENALISQIRTVQSEGYVTSTDYLYGFSYLPLNFNNPKVGKIFDQLYIRQALQDLIDQPSWVDAYDTGLAAPTYGPVPVEPPNTFADAFEKSNPYPYDFSAAKDLLSAHGWTVRPGGTTTCTDPGSAPNQCGAGIKLGTGLSFELEFASGLAYLAQSMADYKAVAAKVGIQFTTREASFGDVIGTAVPCTPTESSCSWEIANWGSGWVYSPDYYPTGEELYATGAGSNAGSYSSTEANALIAKSTTAGESASQSTLGTYQDYIAEELPVLFEPALAGDPSPGLDVAADDLGGNSPNVYGALTPENWYYIKEPKS